MAKKSKKPALGRGLGALLQAQQADQSAALPDVDATETEETVKPAVDMAGTVALLPISAIEANPDQPRRTFEPFALNELADSIKTLGIIQPLTVRRMSAAKYQLISGERRFRASQLAGLDHVPAYVREANDQEMLEMALVENIQREDLDAIEVAISFRRLMEECSLTQEELASRVGKQRSTISNYIRLVGPSRLGAAICGSGTPQLWSCPSFGRIARGQKPESAVPAHYRQGSQRPPDRTRGQ